MYCPHHVNYHIEHHLYPAVPHYNLPRLHAALEQHGILEGAEVRRFGETLPRIFAQPRLAD
jgi:fatty acid desaturase